MSVAVITVASHVQGHFPLLLKSTARQGIPLFVLGFGTPYGGHGMKMRSAYDFLKAHGGQFGHVVLCDAYDMVFAANLEILVERFTALNAEVVFSAERNCYPDAEKAAQYPVTFSPYKHLNSGFWMARPEKMLALLNALDAANIPPEINDQQVFTDAFLAQTVPIVLDYESRLCQSLHMSAGDVEFDARQGRIVNRLTGSTPCVFHGNGSSDMTQVLQWLNL